MSRDNPLDEALVRVSRVVSERVGIVSDVLLPEPQPGDPLVPVAISRPARVDVLGPKAAVNEGEGAALDRGRAILKALAESIERYCAAFQPADLPAGTWSELALDAIPPSAFALFSAEQHNRPGFPFFPFTQQTSVRWTQGRSLSDGRPLLVPAAFVYLPYARAPGEPRLDRAISTGLAMGIDLASATAAALCEVVERDAFMLVWRQRRPTPELDLASVPSGPERRLIDALQAVGMRCRVRLLTQDLEICVLCVITEQAEGRSPHVVLGAGAHGDPRRALQSALEEACLSLFGLNRLITQHGQRARNASASELTTLALQSTAYALRPELKQQAPFLFGPASRTVRLDELEVRFRGAREGSLTALIQALGNWQQHAAVVDCTTPDIEDIGCRVVRVVIPGLQPLDHDNSQPHLGGARLQGRSLNTAPHPFP